MRLAIAGYACAAGRNYVIWVPRGRRRGTANGCPIIGEEARSLTMPLAGSKRTREAWPHRTHPPVGGVIDLARWPCRVFGGQADRTASTSGEAQQSEWQAGSVG